MIECPPEPHEAREPLRRNADVAPEQLAEPAWRETDLARELFDPDTAARPRDQTPRRARGVGRHSPRREASEQPLLHPVERLAEISRLSEPAAELERGGATDQIRCLDDPPHQLGRRDAREERRDRLGAQARSDHIRIAMHRLDRVGALLQPGHEARLERDPRWLAVTLHRALRRPEVNHQEGIAGRQHAVPRPRRLTAAGPQPRDHLAQRGVGGALPELPSRLAGADRRSAVYGSRASAGADRIIACDRSSRALRGARPEQAGRRADPREAD
jgi:hypothetical protein